MRDRIKSFFISLQTWQIMLFSIIGAVLITNGVTVFVSLWIWRTIQLELILLGTINAVLVPLIILPAVIRNLRRVVKLEEENQSHVDMISQLERQAQADVAVQRRADELALLYHLGVSLTSGKNLFDTLLALQTEIMKLIQADAFYVAIHDKKTDIVKYPLFFTDGQPLQEPERLLHEWPGLTGAVIFSGKTLYLPDMFQPEVEETYHPHVNTDLILHTFLGIPLNVDGHILGMLSVQSKVVDAYTADQIRLMENIAVQAATAIDKADLLDQLKQELIERKLVDVQLHEREAILESITFAAEQFLKSSDWRANIDTVLERLGKTIQATHAYIFEQHPGPLGAPVHSMRYEWTAQGYVSDLQNPEFQNSSLDGEGFEHYFATLRSGEPFLGNSSSFLPTERERFKALGIRAILEVPLFVDGVWWGTIGFDDMEQDREWRNAEVDALKIAAGVLSAAIQREKAESAVRESEAIYRRAIEAVDAVPYYLDYKSNSYLFMGAGIQEMTGLSPSEMRPETWLDIVQETVLLGEAEGLSVDEAIQFVRLGKLKTWKCDQRIIRQDGQIRWLTDRSIELLDENGVSHGSIGILQDITERKLIEAGLRQREAILEAVTFAAEQFLKTSDWRLNINTVLEHVGKTINATHAYLFEHHMGENGIEVSSMVDEWTAPGFSRELNNPIYQNMQLIRGGMDGADERLRRGEIVVVNASTISGVEAGHLKENGAKALMEVPLFVDGMWWGTIGFDDMVVERNWSPAEVDALKIAAGILSAAIQRQKADSTVQESERIYRQAIVAAGAVPYYRDYVENRYTFMGAEIEKMIGYKPDEVTTALWRSLVLDDIPTIEGAEISLGYVIGHSRRGKFKEWKSDMRMRVKNGEERWLSDSAIELIDETNVPYASIGILQDITERKLTEVNLRKRESILAAVTFAAEQFLKTSNWRERIELVLERLGREFSASHAYLFEKHVGVNGEIRTSMVYEWTAPDCISDLGNPNFQEMPPQPMGFERMYQILDRGEPLIASTSFFTEAERVYMRSINVKAMLEMRVVVSGKHWGTIGFDSVLNDREWNLMEVDAIKVAANVLGAAIKRQLDEDNLQKELDERQKLIGELENKNSELERFTYTVSHDLKSPLVTINGFLGYLEQDALSGNMDRMKRDLQRIHEAVKKMQNLLNELLELSRIGRVVNAPENVSFNELVREALYIVNGRLEANLVTVFVQPNMPVVNVDKPRIIEVLQNLLDNAAKYMGDQEHPHIEIGVHGEERGMPIFLIKDNGIGISSEFHQRVFGLFDKLDPKSEGTGVGLALVKRIIEVHGGRIWVESELGQGTTFYFTLPVEENPNK